VQQRLERFYDLAPTPSIDSFSRPALDGEREEVLVRDRGEHVELAVTLPAAGLHSEDRSLPLDVLCQVVEGVSHFVYLAAKIEAGDPTTQLELELQAEVDKFAMLAFAPLVEGDREAAHAMHARLYDDVRFLHAAGTEHGDRYRVANDLAARFCARATREPASAARVRLLRFYRGGQGEKIRLARAA
jgi:hypothetical protein